MNDIDDIELGTYILDENNEPVSAKYSEDVKAKKTSKNRLRIRAERAWSVEEQDKTAYKIRFTLNTKSKVFLLGKSNKHRINPYDLINFIKENIEEIEETKEWKNTKQE